MSQDGNAGPHPVPMYQAVSATRNADGLTTFRLLTLQPASSRLRVESLGSAPAQCGHEHCGLIELGEVALVHAYNVQDEMALEGQLPLPFGQVAPE